jgi:N-acetylmuramoyl-L-alanine amidase
VKFADPAAPRPRRTASNSRVVANERFTDLRIPVTERPPYQVEVSGDVLILTLYGTVSNVDIVNFATNDPTVRDVTWEQAASDRVRFTVHLHRQAYGWLALWDRGAFVLRVRRAPAVDAARPLAGRVIAVDPGHPPIGTIGPTGLFEGDAVLDVAEQLRAILEAKGASVVMTRTARGPVALGARPVTARRGDAEAFVSVHLNAYPDGVNPFRARNGTNTYFFYDQAEPLARAVQRGMVRQIGLPDQGINYDNLAVARQSWMPAILCEGAFLMIPEQEAALRDEGFQKRYAAGIAEGLEEYFRSLATKP